MALKYELGEVLLYAQIRTSSSGKGFIPLRPEAETIGYTEWTDIEHF